MLQTTQPPFDQAALASMLAGLSIDDVTRALHRKSFYEFLVYFWPQLDSTTAYLPAKHIRTLCDHLQAVYEGHLESLSIEIGPGYGKSLVCSVAFSCWVWSFNPGFKLGFSTYALELTRRDSRKVRDVVLSDSYKRLYGHIFRLTKVQENYLTNDKGGHRVSMATKGAATGFRFNFWVGDDLLNLRGSDGEASIEDMEVHLMAIATRGQMGKNEDGTDKEYPKVLIGQRLAENDAGGYARKQGYQVLCLPTEFDTSEPCETYDIHGNLFFKDWRTEQGELLFPEGFGPRKVQKIKDELRARAYSAQHQQRPSPAEGGVIKAEYLKKYPLHIPPRFSHFFASVDTNQGQKESNDKAAIVIHGVHLGGISLVDGWTGREAPGRFMERLSAFGDKYNCSCFVIEQKDWGKALCGLLEEDASFKWRIERYTPIVSKNLRAEEASPLFYKGQYSMPDGTPLTQQAQGQLVVFPASKDRDMADAIIQAVIYAQKTYTFGGRGWRYEGASTEDDSDPDDFQSQEDW